MHFIPKLERRLETILIIKLSFFYEVARRAKDARCALSDDTRVNVHQKNAESKREATLPT
jgi:hypothetical protein